MQAIWTALYEGGVEIALTGHSHNYERFAPMNAAGKRDRSLGVREFVVGTGGAFFTGVSSAKPNSEVRQNHTFGVLRITLRPTKYTWKFAPESGKSFGDTGSTDCHDPPGGIPPAPAPEPPLVPDPFPSIVNPRTGAPNGRHAVKCSITGTPAMTSFVEPAEGTPSAASAATTGFSAAAGRTSSSEGSATI